MRYRFPAVPAAAAAVAIALLSGGCSSNNVAASSPPVEKHNLIVGAVPVADSAALYIAQQRGFFRDQGLNVKIEPIISGANAITGQLAGQYDVVLGSYVSYILADAVHNDKFRVLAPGGADSADYSALLVAPGSSIQSVADLKGKTVAVNALNNIGTVFITSELSQYAMGLKADHIRLVVVPFPQMSQALKTHKADAAWVVEPFVTYAEMAGAQPLADTNAGATQNLPLGGYVVTQSWEQKYPGTADAFRRALRQGQEIAATDSSAVWRGLEKYAGMPSSVAEIIALPTYPLANQDEELQRIANLMLQYNMLSQNYDVHQMLR